MSRQDDPIVVLGVGNVLLGDDGIGVQVVRTLERLADRGEIALPLGTSLVDGGTLGRGLLPQLAGARAVLLIDAVDLDRSPGSVAVVRGDALREMRGGGGSMHRGGIGDLLAAAELAGVLPDTVALVGVQPGDIAVGLEPTEAVRASIPAMIEATLDELHRFTATPPVSVAGPVARGHAVAGASA